MREAKVYTLEILMSLVNQQSHQSNPGAIPAANIIVKLYNCIIAKYGINSKPAELHLVEAFVITHLSTIIGNPPWMWELTRSVNAKETP